MKKVVLIQLPVPQFNKARSGLTFVEEALVLDAVRWAWEDAVREIYLLDPCLSARPRLETFIEKIAAINDDRRLGFVSEIRAKSVLRQI